MKNNEYPCKPQFYYIKVGIKGSKLYRHVFVMGILPVEALIHKVISLFGNICRLAENTTGKKNSIKIAKCEISINSWLKWK